MDTSVSGNLLFPSYFTLQSKLALSNRVSKVGSPIDPGRRVAWPFQSLQMPPGGRVCPQPQAGLTTHHYLVRITPGDWGPSQFIRTGAQGTGQSRRPILLLGPWLRGRRSRLRKWVHSSAIRAGWIHKIQTQHPARSVPLPITTTQSGGRKVAEPPVIESRGPSCKMAAEME